MGSFSWLRADQTTKQVTINYGDPYKFLIPKEFGGGYIKDNYRDYGNLQSPDGKIYDIYELLAFWNANCILGKTQLMKAKDVEGIPAIQLLVWEGDFTGLKEVDNDTDNNRCIGIDLACYDQDMVRLKYPLKLVSASYKGSYEDCIGISYSDPDQGFSRYTRDSQTYRRYLEARIRKFRELGISDELAYRGLD